MATAQFSGTANAAIATATSSGGVGSALAAASAADTAVGVTVTGLTTAFTAADVFGNALVAITGDTYSNTTHLFTTGGATGLNHAQWITLAAEYNTAITDFITAQTANTAAKVLTAATVTAAGGVAGTADVVLYFGNVANVGSMDVLLDILNAIVKQVAGSGLLTAGSANPRNLG